MKSCKKCGSVSTISLFISAAAVILALMAYFHKIKLTEGLEGNTKWATQRGQDELIYNYDGTEVMKLKKNGDMLIRGQLLVDGDITVGANVVKKKEPYYITLKDSDKFIQYGKVVIGKKDAKGKTLLSRAS